jgi:hypothetical protein
MLTRPTSGPPAARPGGRLLALAGGLLLALLLSACSGGGGVAEHDPDPSLGAGAPTTLSLKSLETTLRPGVVSGRLPREARQRTLRAVGRVVDGWIDAAYVGGDYPRRDFRHAFPGFTRSARLQARADGHLMSNQAIGARIDGVRPVHRVVLVDVLAVGGHAVGATARVRLGFRTTGRVERRFVVRARLALSRTDGWQVFAYDASEGSVA